MSVHNGQNGDLCNSNFAEKHFFNHRRIIKTSTATLESREEFKLSSTYAKKKKN